jgi:hypothetical protein
MLVPATQTPTAPFGHLSARGHLAPSTVVHRRWVSHTSRYQGRQRPGDLVWRRFWRGRGRLGQSFCCRRDSLFDRRAAAHLMQPFFKRFFPTEINQRNNNDYFNKQPHSKGDIVKIQTGTQVLSPNDNGSVIRFHHLKTERRPAEKGGAACIQP